jgi:hypothetical protein
MISKLMSKHISYDGSMSLPKILFSCFCSLARLNLSQTPAFDFHMKLDRSCGGAGGPGTLGALGIGFSHLILFHALSIAPFASSTDGYYPLHFECFPGFLDFSAQLFRYCSRQTKHTQISWRIET